jgi:hypothetical protein
MRKFISRAALLGSLGAALMMGGCATVESVEHAQATADQAQQTATAAGSAAAAAQNTANQAMTAANTAQAGVHTNADNIQSLTQQVAELKNTKRVAERD